MRSTRTRWPTFSVGTIDGLGMRNGLTRKAWIPIASPSATAMITTNSTTEAAGLFFFPFSLTGTRDLNERKRHQASPASSPSADSAAAEGRLADREGLARAAALALQHGALENLGPAPGSLDDLEVDLDAVARLELRHVAQLCALEAFDDSGHGFRGATTRCSRRASG